MRPFALLLVLVSSSTILACSGSEDSAAASDAIVAEHSKDDRTTAVISLDPQYAYYCELSFDRTVTACAPENAVAMSRAGYEAKLGVALDKVFPEYAGATAAARAKLDAASKALSDQEAIKAGLVKQIQDRAAVLETQAAPLEQQLASTTNGRDSLVARATYLDSEITRVNGRLADSSLSQTDREVLTQKLGDLQAERATNATQRAAAEAQIADLQSQIATVKDRDPQLVDLTQKLQAATAALETRKGDVNAATQDVSQSVAARDGKLSGMLAQLAGTGVLVSDAGDTTSRFAFDPFRTAPRFATNDACRTLTKDVRFGGADRWQFDWRVDVASDVILPASGFVAEEDDPTRKDGVTIGSPDGYPWKQASEHAAQYSYSYAVSMFWPSLHGLSLPGGALTCAHLDVTP